MKQKTYAYVQKVQQALLTLLDPVLFAVIQLFCLYASQHPAIIKRPESEYAPEGWRRLMREDSQQLRNMLSGFSLEDIYHSVVLLAANAFAIGSKNEQQKSYLIREQSRGFYGFMEY